MAINYPGSLDINVGIGTTQVPLSTGGKGGESHLLSHQDINDSSVALQTIVGITNSTVTTTHEYRIRRYWIGHWEGSSEAYFPTSNSATSSVINGISNIVFPQSVVSNIMFMGRVPWGTVLTSGVVVRMSWSNNSVTAGNVQWSVAFDRWNTGSVITPPSFGTPATGTTNTSNIVSTMTETAITTTNIASMVAGDVFMLNVQRVGTGDTMLGNAVLWNVTIENAL